ncbi:hypothetical protein T4E_8073 [Trichinella pseudospiralis]|uniref:Uncharacterized protein n=1 Tax=Trichinella pseudospiralis TaxID=6337 RepID=A0A0V0YHS4_TRIPS|nr:hypothetical protein T4E_8073 [Trichinella pseudospiralis]
MTYQVFYHSWCTNPQSSFLDLARLKCLIHRVTNNHWGKSHRSQPPTKYHAPTPTNHLSSRQPTTVIFLMITKVLNTLPPVTVAQYRYSLQ